MGSPRCSPQDMAARRVACALQPSRLRACSAASRFKPPKWRARVRQAVANPHTGLRSGSAPLKPLGEGETQTPQAENAVESCSSAERRPGVGQAPSRSTDARAGHGLQAGISVMDAFGFTVMLFPKVGLRAAATGARQAATSEPAGPIHRHQLPGLFSQPPKITGRAFYAAALHLWLPTYFHGTGGLGFALLIGLKRRPHHRGGTASRAAVRSATFKHTAISLPMTARMHASPRLTAAGQHP